MKSRVHPEYKTKYRVANWAEYERSLVQRGDITLWIQASCTNAETTDASPAQSSRRAGSTASKLPPSV